MKRVIISRFTLLFAVFTALWSIFSFFNYKRSELYTALPAEIVAELKKDSNTETILYDQILDKFILKYPSLNLSTYNEKFRGAKSVSLHKFFFLTVKGIPDKVKNITKKTFAASEVIKKNGFVLYKFEDNYPHDEFYLSSNIQKLAVVSINGEVRRKANFFMGEFKTGLKSWHRFYVSSGSFDNGQFKMINSHPIGGEGSALEITVPPENAGYTDVYFRHAIASSGKCSECPPVVTKIEQAGNIIEIFTSDSIVKDTELKGFRPDKPFKFTVMTLKDGKRHFFFDIIYRKTKQ